jgi:hypothetical protein
VNSEAGWLVASGKAILIFAYFVLATVWLPSWVLRLDAVAGASGFVQDVVGTGVWLVAFVAGLWGLRRSQSLGWI